MYKPELSPDNGHETNEGIKYSSNVEAAASRNVRTHSTLQTPSDTVAMRTVIGKVCRIEC